VISPAAYVFDRQRIVVADEDSPTSALIVITLRREGHCVALEPGALAAGDFFFLTRCHLLISSVRVEGRLRMDLLQELQHCLPALPILYLADASPSPTDLDAHLPLDLPTLRAPFTTGELLAAVRRLLPQLRAGTVLARLAEQSGPSSDAPVPGTILTQ